MGVSIANITRYPNSGNLGMASFSIPTTVAGNLLVVMSVMGAGANWVYLTANNDTLVQIPFYGLAVFGGGGAAGDAAYFPGSGVSADIWWCTTIGNSNLISFECSANPYLWVYELTGASGWAVDDYEGSGASSTSQAPVVGPSLNGSSQDVYFSVPATDLGNVTAVSSPWTLDSTSLFGDAPAYILNGSGVEQATFTDSHGNDGFTIAAASFKYSASLCGPPKPTGNPYQLPQY